MVSISLKEDELELLAELVKRERETFRKDEPLRPDPILLDAEVEYEEFLKKVAEKLQKAKKRK